MTQSPSVRQSGVQECQYSFSSLVYPYLLSCRDNLGLLACLWEPRTPPHTIDGQHAGTGIRKSLSLLPLSSALCPNSWDTNNSLASCADDTEANIAQKHLLLATGPLIGCGLPPKIRSKAVRSHSGSGCPAFVFSQGAGVYSGRVSLQTGRNSCHAIITDGLVLCNNLDAA